MKTMKTLQSVKIATLVLTGLSVVPHAWADSIPLTAQTTLVDGTQTTTSSFVAQTAGTVTVSLTDMNWSSALSALSFTANTASQVLASFNETNGTGATFSFNVGPGSYFANIMATAGGSMDLGVYSLNMNFTPSVPLPSSGWLLLTGMFALLGVARAVRPFEVMGTAEA